MQSFLQFDLFSDFILPDSITRAEEPSSRPNHRKILIQNQLVEYELQRSNRRSIGFLINAKGLKVTAPKWVTIAQIEQAINERGAWIFRKLHEFHERTQRGLENVQRYHDQCRIPFKGQAITCHLREDLRDIAFDGSDLHLPLTPHAGEQQIKDRVHAWLQHEALTHFTLRLDHYAQHLGCNYNSVRLSDAKTRWGSCTSQGKISLNWRLIQFSEVIIDYVVAHELAHLKEMNHSARFWATVESIFPEYQFARHALKEQARHTAY